MDSCFECYSEKGEQHHDTCLTCIDEIYNNHEKSFPRVDEIFVVTIDILKNGNYNRNKCTRCGKIGITLKLLLCNNHAKKRKALEKEDGCLLCYCDGQSNSEITLRNLCIECISRVAGKERSMVLLKKENRIFNSSCKLCGQNGTYIIAVSMCDEHWERKCEEYCEDYCEDYDYYEYHSY